MASNSRLSKDKKLIKLVAIALACVAICFVAGAAIILYLHQQAPRLNTSSDANSRPWSTNHFFKVIAFYDNEYGYSAKVDRKAHV